MKNFSRNALGLVLTSLFAGSAFAATSKPAPKPAPSQAVATPAAAGASAEIELVHTLGADKGDVVSSRLAPGTPVRCRT